MTNAFTEADLDEQNVVFSNEDHELIVDFTKHINDFVVTFDGQPVAAFKSFPAAQKRAQNFIKTFNLERVA